MYSRGPQTRHGIGVSRSGPAIVPDGSGIFNRGYEETRGRSMLLLRLSCIGRARRHATNLPGDARFPADSTASVPIAFERLGIYTSPLEITGVASTPLTSEEP